MKKNSNKIILGIETSCDETAATIVEDGIKVLSSTVASSLELQKKFGGIIPEQAAREQIKCIIPIIQEAIKTAFKTKKQKTKNLSNYASMYTIDAIAVTQGPGLIGSLIIGIETAKTLSLVFKKPIMPVNHLIAHIYANFLEHPATSPDKIEDPSGFTESSRQSRNRQSRENQQPDDRKKTILATGSWKLAAEKQISVFPAMCLIVSGGHTDLVLMKNHSQFQWIGGTKDDAAGECLDKSARLLGFGYPGGPAIEAAASSIQQPEISNQKPVIKLPRPMINDDNFDFSFSGLKTAVLYLVKKLKKTNQQLTINNQQLISYELQEAVTDVLVKKTVNAAMHFKVKSILVGGGVAANQRLRDKFQSAISNQPSTRTSSILGKQSTHQKFCKTEHLGGQAIKLFFPEKKWCTDNAASIACAAYFNPDQVQWAEIKPLPSLHF